MKYVAPLTDVEIQTLQEMHRYHPSRRARMRAHCLLLSHQGVSMPHIARIYQVAYRSVSSWIDQWQTGGFVGLYDQPGAGRRPTLSLDEQQKVQQYLQDSPKDLKKVGIPVRRDDLVSVVYSTELNSTTSLVPPQRTDQYGILDEKPPTFQRLSG